MTSRKVSFKSEHYNTDGKIEKKGQKIFLKTVCTVFECVKASQISFSKSY